MITLADHPCKKTGVSKRRFFMEALANQDFFCRMVLLNHSSTMRFS